MTGRPDPAADGDAGRRAVRGPARSGPAWHRLTQDRLALTGLVLAVLVTAGLVSVAAKVTADSPAFASASTTPAPHGTDEPAAGDDSQLVHAETRGAEAGEVLGRVSTPDRALTEVGDAREFVLEMDVYFAPGSADLLPRALVDLGHVAQRVQRAGQESLVVQAGRIHNVPRQQRVGHGPPLVAGDPNLPIVDAHTMQLWRQRADAVVASLAPLLPGVDVQVGEMETLTSIEHLALGAAAEETADWRVVITAAP